MEKVEKRINLLQFFIRIGAEQQSLQYFYAVFRQQSAGLFPTGTFTAENGKM